MSDTEIDFSSIESYRTLLYLRGLNIIFLLGILMKKCWIFGTPITLKQGHELGLSLFSLKTEQFY